MIDAQGFHRNREGDFNGLKLIENTLNALRRLDYPLSVATTSYGKRRYFFGNDPLKASDKDSILRSIHDSFGLKATLRSLAEAMKIIFPIAAPDKLQRQGAGDVESISRMDWFRSLSWDRRNRIENFLAGTAGASPAHSLTFARWLVCGAWRTLEPGARAFGIAFRGASEAETVAALEALTGPWLGIGFIAERLPSTFKSQVTEKLIIHASKHDRREPEVFSLLAARVEDYIAEETGEATKRTFTVACTLTDDEALPDAFKEVRVTGLDVEAIRRDRNQLWAEARECAVAAMLKTNPTQVLRAKRQRWFREYYDFNGGVNA